ncbi:MAG: thiamine phosphate synthase [Chloroflexi bacterium]|nr:thiamine phosphate synthase [Chloroflexota bacterium]
MDYDLYVVIDEDYRPGLDLAQLTHAVAENGASVIQLRCKHSCDQRFYDLALSLRQVTLCYRLPLIINDRLDIALAVDADGVHLGQEDLPASVARRILGEGKIIGVSAATPEEARLAAEAGASYLGVGAIFATGTKSDAGDPIGPEAISAIRPVCSLPLVGIGGIALANAASVIRAGGDGVAIVSAIMGSDDPASATAALLRTVKAAKSELLVR